MIRPALWRTIAMALLLALSLTALPAQAVEPQQRTQVEVAAPAKSITDSGLATLEIKEGCAKSPKKQICKLTGNELLKAARNGAAIGQKMAANPIVNSLLAEAKKRRGNLNEAQVRDVFDKVDSVGRKEVPAYRTALGKLKPNKLLIAAWAVNTGLALADKNASAPDKIEAVVSIVPILGHVVSFGNSMRKEDISGVISATVGLGTVVAGIGCPPLALALAFGQVFYAMAKAFFAAFAAFEDARDWTKNPPGTLQEVLEEGGRIEWENPRGGTLVVGPKGGTKTLSVVFSSVYDETVVYDHRVSYDLKPLQAKKLRDSRGKEIYLTASQFTTALRNRGPLGSRKGYNYVTAKNVSVVSDGSTIGGSCQRAAQYNGLGIGASLLSTTDACGPQRKVTVRPDHPAVVTMTFATKGNYCADAKRPAGCTIDSGNYDLLYQLTPRNGKPLTGTAPVTVKG
ncbi:hypothetical protein [Streptomyces sp. UNOC14_S4]|uniref:hypothetical protein n=1 Tax=Streptomyces sp. UNOC14_S4 TaxID=2872340 RepID=UPI001E3DFF26|nr:hypothetical protein [Streptomyces sp. UNOC14_S4]MCC3767846.1 hypothetical protein [Streptomyces sp. UNOC14_S4]